MSSLPRPSGPALSIAPNAPGASAGARAVFAHPRAWQARSRVEHSIRKVLSSSRCHLGERVAHVAVFPVLLPKLLAQVRLAHVRAPVLLCRMLTQDVFASRGVAGWAELARPRASALASPNSSNSSSSTRSGACPAWFPDITSVRMPAERTG